MYRDFDRNTPVFLQIGDKIRKDILSGAYPLGAQIPTVRQIAIDLSANPNTVQRALALLEEEGLVYTRGTLGRFVTTDPEVISAARRRAQHAALKRLLAEVHELGITNGDIIEFIKKEGKNE